MLLDVGENCYLMQAKLLLDVGENVTWCRQKHSKNAITKGNIDAERDPVNIYKYI